MPPYPWHSTIMPLQVEGRAVHKFDASQCLGVRFGSPTLFIRSCWNNQVCSDRSPSPLLFYNPPPRFVVCYTRDSLHDSLMSEFVAVGRLCVLDGGNPQRKGSIAKLAKVPLSLRHNMVGSGPVTVGAQDGMRQCIEAAVLFGFEHPAQ